MAVKNMNAKTWALAVASDGKRYSDPSQAPAGDTLTITGSGFGAGPTVVLFDRADGVAGETVQTTDADVGEWTQQGGVNKVGAPAYATFLGRAWWETGSLSSSLGLLGMRKTFTATKEFRSAFRFGTPTGYEWPLGGPSDGPLMTSGTKPCWFGNTNGSDDGIYGDEYADIIVANMAGASGCNMFGNSVTLISGHREFMPTANANQMTPGNMALVSWHQNPVDGDDFSTSGVTHRFAMVGAGLANSNVYDQTSPYGTGAGLTETAYNVVNFPGWIGNDTSATVRQLYCDFYLATGPNSGKMIVLHDAATIAASSGDNTYIVPPASWSDTEIVTIPTVARERQPYYSILSATGSVIQTGATGW